MPRARLSGTRKAARDGWKIHRLGHSNGIKVYANKKAKKGPVAIVDIGSNSVKLVLFNTTPSIPMVIDQNGKQCGLGKKMVPNDPDPCLSKHAIRVIRKDVLPKWKKLLAGQKTKPNAFIVMATEAVRAAANNKGNPEQVKTVKELFRDFADTLGIPASAINIVSEKQEACLTGQTMMCGGHSGYGIMIGGNSCEFVKVRNGKTIRHATLRFGMASLASNPNAKRIIKEGFDSIPWFSDSKGPDAKRSTKLCVMGGTPRAAGREAAEVIERIPYSSKMPFGGYILEGGWELKAFLGELGTTTRSQLFNNSFGTSMNHIMRRSRKICGETHVQILRKGKEPVKAWVKVEDFKKMKDEWDEKIGSRAHLMQAFALVMLEAEKRLRPYSVNFSPHNMREGSLRYTGLGYM